MAGASRELTIAGRAEQTAQGLDAERDAEFLEHPLRKVDETPADDAVNSAVEFGLAEPGQRILILAGTPFGAPGAANLLRLAHAPTGPKTRRS